MGLPLSDQMEKLMAREPMAIETLGKWQEAAPEADEAWLLDLEEDKSRIVHLTKIYTCGEESSVLGIMTPEEIATLMKDHPAWEGRLGAGGDVWIEEKIDGLSDTCKTRGYIGLDRDGNLTLFDGPPKKEKVIRTFFPDGRGDDGERFAGGSDSTTPTGNPHTGCRGIQQRAVHLQRLCDRTVGEGHAAG